MTETHDEQVATYYEQISAWNWKGIVEDAKQNPPETDDVGTAVACTRIGSVMTLTPSGKVYAPWTTNQTERDVHQDTAWWEALERAAGDHDGWIEVGEHDPTDIFFCIFVSR